MSYHVVFILNFYVMFLLMKLFSWYLHPEHKRQQLFAFLLASPLFSARNYRQQAGHTEPFSIILLKLILTLAYLVSIIFLARYFLQPLSYFEILLISPMIYIFTEFMGALGQLLFYPAQLKIPPIHKHPLTSKSLGEFWGRRWNIWIQDWLRDVTRPQSKRLPYRLLVTFLVSGLFHELMVNLPYYLCFGKSYFGNMTLYFIVQGLGLWIEKKWLKVTPAVIRRIYLWLLVILPAPIFINRPLLMFFGIINE